MVHFWGRGAGFSIKFGALCHKPRQPESDTNRIEHTWTMMMKRGAFNAGQEPMVKTTISDQCARNECQLCPGILSNPQHEDAYCLHSCHVAKNQDQ